MNLNKIVFFTLFFSFYTACMQKDYCVLCFTTVLALKTHYQFVHKAAVKKIDQCELCNFCTLNRRTMHHHVRAKHQKVDEFYKYFSTITMPKMLRIPDLSHRDLWNYSQRLHSLIEPLPEVASAPFTIDLIFNCDTPQNKVSQQE